MISNPKSFLTTLELGGVNIPERQQKRFLTIYDYLISDFEPNKISFTHLPLIKELCLYIRNTKLGLISLHINSYDVIKTETHVFEVNKGDILIFDLNQIKIAEAMDKIKTELFLLT